MRQPEAGHVPEQLEARRIFRPRYPASTRAAMIGLPLAFFSLLIWAALRPSTLPALFWMAILLLGICTALIPFFTIRDILFLDPLVIRRHFLPESLVAVKEIESMGPATISVGGRSIPVGRMENLEDLQAMVDRWKAALALKAAARQPSQMPGSFPTRGYGAYASFWGLVLGVLVMILQPAWLPVDPRWLLGATFLVVYILFIYVLPRRL